MVDVSLYSYMDSMLKQTPLGFKRYMYDKIAWNNRLVGVVGPRGVGKSTMLLQYIKENGNDKEYLYVSTDHTYFTNHSLIDLIDDFVKYGGTRLFVDEVHKYKTWSRELKQAYDVYPNLKIVFTGSSVLDIIEGEADLSRRALMYSMQGLSFREYLGLFHNINVPSFDLPHLLEHKIELKELEHPLPLFQEYLKTGYYPFSKEDGFQIRMENIIDQTVGMDIPQYADMKASTARKLKRMLVVISQLAPYKPNAESLATEIGVSKNNISDYLVYLEKAGMIGMLRDETGGLRGLGKVEKVYVDNPNLMNVLSGGNPDTGNVRETFFYNQMRVMNDVISSKKADFVIDNFTFEVGGKNKKQKQITDISDSYVVKDDIELGHGNVIPLWYFGMNY